MRTLSAVFVFVIAFVAVTILGGSWYTVDEGDRGVVLRNGRIIGVAEPGFHLKLPWVDDVEHISTRSWTRIYDHMESYSRDQQPAHFKVSVNYRIPLDQVEEVYSQYGDQENLIARTIDRHVPQQMKVVFGNFTAATSIQERERLNIEVLDAIQKAVTGPILVESVQVEDVKFSSDYEDAVKARMQAEVEVQKIRQNAEREKVSAEIAVIQAKARADSLVAEAAAQAEATRLQGEATAKAIELRGEALAKNPGLVLLTQAERWDGKLPSTMLPDGTLPFFDVTPQQTQRLSNE